MPVNQEKFKVACCDTALIEKKFEETCFGKFQLIHRLELRRLATSLWFNEEIKKQGTANKNYTEPLKALTNLKANLQRRVAQLSTLLNDESSQQEAMTIIRSLIDRIEITPGEKRGDPQVQLVGGLAAILELAVSKQQKTTIQSDSGFGRVLMVAGAGFEPATFRL